MKILRRCLPIAIASLCAFSAAHADFESDFSKATAKAIKYVDMHPGEIWPEFTLSDKPTVAYFNEDTDHIYAYHYIPAHQGWNLLNIENTPVYFRGKNDIELSQGYGASYLGNVDGQQAYIYLPTFYDNHTLQNNMLWMIGSRFYDSVFAKHVSDVVWLKLRESYFDSFNQLENIKLAYLSDDALKTYLQTNNIESLKDYAALEYLRFKISNKHSKDFEWSRMVVMGPENYVGLKSQNLNEKEYAQTILNSSSYQDWCGSIKNSENIHVCMTYERFEFVAQALGYALDKVGYEGWKTSLAGSPLSMQDVLLASLKMDQAEMIQRVEDAKIRYHYDQRSEQIDGIMKPYLAQLGELKEQYNKMPGVELSFNDICWFTTVPSLGNDGFILSDRSYINKNYSFETSCKSSNGTSIDAITMTHIPVHYGSYYGSDMSDYFDHQIKISSDTTLVIDGKQETAGAFVAAHKVKAFNSLMIKNSEVNVEINEKGMIDGSNDKLTFKLWTHSSPMEPMQPTLKQDKKKFAFERYLKLQHMFKNMKHT